jgi:hypothetical protein
VNLKITDAKGIVVFESKEYYTNQEITVGKDLGIGLYIISAVVGEQTVAYKVVKQ